LFRNSAVEFAQMSMSPWNLFCIWHVLRVKLHF